ncbi:hypothetical protein J6590_106402, partial [Homalodisca vitripennis]
FLSGERVVIKTLRVNDDNNVRERRCERELLYCKARLTASCVTVLTAADKHNRNDNSRSNINTLTLQTRAVNSHASVSR